MMIPGKLLIIRIALFASPLAFTQTSSTTVCYFDTKIPKAQNGLRMTMDEMVNSLNQSLDNVLLKTYLFNSTLNHLEALSLLPDCQLTMLTSPSCLIASTVMASTPRSPLLLLTHDPCPELTQPESSLQEDGSCSNHREGQQVVHVSLAPWLLHWVQATCDVIRTVSWSEVALVMDDTLPPARHGELISCLTLNNIGSVTLKVKSLSRDVILSLMTSLATTYIRNFLLCVNSLTSSALVSLMKDKDMNFADYHTLVACPGARPDDITTARALGLRVLVMTYTSPDVRSDVTAALSDPCGFLPSYQQIATDQVLSGLSKLNTTFPFSSSCNTTDTPFLCSQASETTLSEEQQQKKGKNVEFSEDDVELSKDDVEFSVCGSREWSSLNPLTEVAVWRPARPHQLSVIHPYALTDHFTHFANLTLTVATLEALPFVKYSSHGSTVSYEGFCIDILNAIAAQLNFTYVITSPQDNMYGAPEEDGTWNGMVGMVKRGEADLAIGPFTITSVRERVVDFTVPYMEDGGGILSRKTDSTPDLMRIFSPFHADIWLATGGMVVVFGLVLFVIMKYDPEHSPPSCLVDQEEGQDLGRVQQRGQLHANSWNIAMSIWTIFGSLMGQGAAKHPRRTSARFVLGCWWVFTILIMSIYTATLAAMLTVTKQPGLIDSIDQLAAASDLAPIAMAGTNWETLFKRTADIVTVVQTAEIGVYKEIGQRMQEGPKVLEVHQALQHVKDGTGVFLGDISQLDFIYRQDCQTLHLAKRVFSANGLGFVLPQQAPFKRAFNRIILKLQEGGFMSMWRKRWWQGEGGCWSSNQGGTSLSQGNQLGTESIGGILLLYGVVVVLAAISMALQCLKATSVCSRITNTSMFHRRQQPSM